MSNNWRHTAPNQPLFLMANTRSPIFRSFDGLSTNEEIDDVLHEISGVLSQRTYLLVLGCFSERDFAIEIILSGELSWRGEWIVLTVYRIAQPRAAKSVDSERLSSSTRRSFYLFFLAFIVETFQHRSFPNFRGLGEWRRRHPHALRSDDQFRAAHFGSPFYFIFRPKARFWAKFRKKHRPYAPYRLLLSHTYQRSRKGGRN